MFWYSEYFICKETVKTSSLVFKKVRNTEEVGLVSPRDKQLENRVRFPPAEQVGILLFLVLRTRSS